MREREADHSFTVTLVKANAGRNNLPVKFRNSSSKLTIFKNVYTDIFFLFKNSTMSCSFTVPEKNLHRSSFRLHGTRGTGQGFKRHTVQVFNLISSFNRLRVRFHLYADSCTQQTVMSCFVVMHPVHNKQSKCLHSLCGQSLEPSNEPLTKKPTPKLRMEKKLGSI